VLYEASLLGDDGIFADSLSVPQYLGADRFSPPLRYFVGEAAGTARIDSFMRYEAPRLHGKLSFIANAGSWVTTRDRTDYAIPDGVMIEGFAGRAHVPEHGHRLRAAVVPGERSRPRPRTRSAAHEHRRAAANRWAVELWVRRRAPEGGVCGSSPRGGGWSYRLIVDWC
jgi:hypothetical protein